MLRKIRILTTCFATQPSTARTFQQALAKNRFVVVSVALRFRSSVVNAPTRLIDLHVAYITVHTPPTLLADLLDFGHRTQSFPRFFQQYTYHHCNG